MTKKLGCYFVRIFANEMFDAYSRILKYNKKKHPALKKTQNQNGGIKISTRYGFSRSPDTFETKLLKFEV
jgi:hypothetical protein